MSISPLVEPDDLADAPRHKPWNALHALGWSVAFALVGQERRIAELEQRLRRFEDAQAGEDAKEASGSPAELG